MNIIEEYLSYKRKINEIWDGLDRMIEENAITKTSLAEGITKIRELTLFEALKIQKHFSSLSEEQLLRVVEGDERDYDLSSAEKLDAITDLFSFVVQPSDPIVQAHNRHVERIEKLEES